MIKFYLIDEGVIIQKRGSMFIYDLVLNNNFIHYDYDLEFLLN